jgi:hypothetical protein
MLGVDGRRERRSLRLPEFTLEAVDWDNMGTVIAHRLSTMESCLMVTSAIGDYPTHVETDPSLPSFPLTMPEDLALYRKYIGDPKTGGAGGSGQGGTRGC